MRTIDYRSLVSKNLINIVPSASIRISEQVNILKKSYEDLIDLTIGEPDFATPQHIKELYTKNDEIHLETYPGKYDEILKELKKVKADILYYIGEGRALVDICKLESMPPRFQVNEWVLHDDEFHLLYTRARQLQAEYYAEQIVMLSELMVRKSLEGTLNGQVAMAIRTHLETIKWITCKMHPRVYGAQAMLSYNPIEAKKAIVVKFEGDETE